MQLIDPIPGHFTYVAWRVSPPRLITTASSTPRRDLLDQVATLLPSLGPAATDTRLFEVTSIAPVPGRPTNDVIALVNAGTDLTRTIEQAAIEAGIAPSLTLPATNAARFGATDAHPGPFLLNHFVGDVTADRAAQAWRTISNWYADTLGVDNSTLLQFEPQAPFVITNYVGIPTNVPRFMAAQMLRPSFYGNVARPLSRLGLRPCPVFARRIPIAQ